MKRSSAGAESSLLDLVQQSTVRYFWDLGHPHCGMALDRSIPGEYGPDAIAVGGSGFGVMAMLVGIERGWIGRDEGAKRIGRILSFLGEADRFHGVFPHFMNGRTGRVIPFGPLDDGGDIVETAFLMAGLLAARQYFHRPDPGEETIRRGVEALWHAVDWHWHTRGGSDTFYWHWSPRHGWAMDFPVKGWNECLLAYVLAAGSPTHPIDTAVYRRCWTGSPTFRNGRAFYGVTLPLGPDFGGPLCFAHYSFLGLDPRGLVDDHADYWEQNVAQTRINREHCVCNPNSYAGYGPACWGLTASDDDRGYNQHAPDNDSGVISPTAALSSMPYTPAESMRALHTFLGPMRERLLTPYGLCDAFCEQRSWYAPAMLAIDQGPIVGMIENHRSGLLWDLVMSCQEVRVGLQRLGFRSPRLGEARA